MNSQGPARPYSQVCKSGLRRTLVLIALTLMTTAVGVGSAQPMVRAASAVACGVERWDVKTMSDPAASRVSLTPLPTTVEALRALNMPGQTSLHTPRFPAEMKTYTVKATLLEAALEKDRDYHLVIAGARRDTTMIVEIPDPTCLTSRTNPTVIRSITKARKYFDQTFGKPNRSPNFTQIRGSPKVTITGVLFFDRIHNQTGVAPNGVELHPVLDIHSP